MEARDFETIDQFLKIVERGDLFEYYGLPQDVTDEVVEEAIKKRRSWAQGQQSNPKFRTEALWIIKHMSLIRRALLEERAAYREAAQRKGIERALEKLTVFIEGSLADGVMNPTKESSILEQASRLGVPAERALERAMAVLSGRASARGGDGGAGPTEQIVDYYLILRVPADADASAIEEAHRARYREARDLADKMRASELYANLDEAWRVLRDGERRAAYDARRREYMLALERRAAGEDGEFKGFLPPPPRKRRPEAETLRNLEPDPTPEPEPMEVLLTQAARVVHEAPPPRASQPSRPPSSARPTPTIPPSEVRLPQPTPAASPVPVSSVSLAEPAQQATSSLPVPTPPARAAGAQEAIRSANSAAASARQRQRAPQLEIEGPEVHKVRAGNAPVAVQFVVRNAGQGQMSGRVLSDREWVKINPTRLDPNRQEQVVEAVIQPTQMPRRQAISLVTVVADHGERRSITIDVERRTLPPAALIAGLALLVALVVALVLAFAM